MTLLCKITGILAILFIATVVASAASDASVRGTLVIAVPTRDGLTVCADKRLYNVESGQFTDAAVKIKAAGRKSVFVATNTVAFYDRKRNKVVFDATKVVAGYLEANPFLNNSTFWSGLRREIESSLRSYLRARPFEEWPETERANGGLLFNLFFYSAGEGVPLSHTVKVFYEKRRTPLIHTSGPITARVAKPKLSGKGRDVLGFLAKQSELASDPLMLRFDERIFRPESVSFADAATFAAKLFKITSAGVPAAQVSESHDCALLNGSGGIRWIRGGDTADLSLEPNWKAARFFYVMEAIELC